MNDEKKPLAIAGLVGVIVIAIGVFTWTLMRQPSGGDASAIAQVAKEIQAKPDTPSVPPEQIQAQVIARGAPGGGMLGGSSKKNHGR